MYVPDEVDREEAIKRVMRLPPRDQVWVWDQLTTYLAGGVDAETEDARATRNVAEALDVMQRVMKHLHLDDVDALQGPAFDRACQELGIDWTSRHVAGIFGRWRTAKLSYAGERPPESLEQRRKRLSWRQRGRTHEAHFDAVRQWLQTDPPLLHQKDFDLWMTRHNDRLSPSEKPSASAGAMTDALLVPWSTVIAVATGEVALADAQAARLVEFMDPTANPLRLATIWPIALRLGIGRAATYDRARQADFPVPVARLGQKNVWLYADVEDYASGKKPPTRQRHELDDEILDSAQVSALLGGGLSPHSVKVYLSTRPRDIPPVAGAIGPYHYWTRSGVIDWIAEERDGRPT